MSASAEYIKPIRVTFPNRKEGNLTHNRAVFMENAAHTCASTTE